MKKIFNIIFIALCVIIGATSCACTVVDNSEVGIKFKKFDLTEQGELKTVPVTGWIIYNAFTTSVFTYPVFIQRVDYDPFTVNTKDAAIFTMDPLLAYQIDRDKATQVFTKYRKPLKDI